MEFESECPPMTNGTMPLITMEDRDAISDLISLYGIVIDEKKWGLVSTLFTKDAVYDITDFGAGVLHGAEVISAYWQATTLHPLAHHATNVLVRGDRYGNAVALSKGIGVGRGGKVGSVTYYDESRRADSGWRISKRVAILRKADRSSDADLLSRYLNA
jgi:SnoaL-like domain